jgi:hypothetical protein
MARLIHAPKSTEATGTRAMRVLAGAAAASAEFTKDGGRIAIIDMNADPTPRSPRKPIVWNGCATLATATHKG